jgi:hypothetical protein
MLEKAVDTVFVLKVAHSSVVFNYSDTTPKSVIGGSLSKLVSNRLLNLSFISNAKMKIFTIRMLCGTIPAKFLYIISSNWHHAYN